MTLGSGRASAEFQFTTAASEFPLTYTISVAMPASTDFDFYVFKSASDRQAVIEAWEARNDFDFVNTISGKPSGKAIGSSGDSTGNPLENEVTGLSGGTTYYILVIDYDFLGGAFTLKVS